MAKEAKKWGRCFNCGEEGHRWADCTKPLKESLKQVKERVNHKKQALNQCNQLYRLRFAHQFLAQMLEAKVS